MYPLGKNQYPTLVQKHFNGAAPCQINFVNLIWLLSELDNHQARWFLLEKCKCEEAAVLAKWLKGVTLSVAHITGTEHAMLPAIFDIGSLRCLFFFGDQRVCAKLRLRAAVFVNLVAMRSAMARSRNGFVTLKEQHVSLLQRSNYLLRSALNSFSFLSECCL